MGKKSKTIKVDKDLGARTAKVKGVREAQAFYQAEPAEELIYVDGLAASMHETVADMYALGMVDQETMREFDTTCLTPVRSYNSKAVKALREREQVSQAVLSHYLGVAVNTVGQWERGDRKPTGAAAKMLALIEKYGINYVR